MPLHRNATQALYAKTPSLSLLKPGQPGATASVVPGTYHTVLVLASCTCFVAFRFGYDVAREGGRGMGRSATEAPMRPFGGAHCPVPPVSLVLIRIVSGWAEGASDHRENKASPELRSMHNAGNGQDVAMEGAAIALIYFGRRSIPHVAQIQKSMGLT